MKAKDIPRPCDTCIHMKAWNLRMNGDHDFSCSKKPPSKYGDSECDKLETMYVKEQDILKDDTPMVATAFRGSDLTKEEESALDHLFDMMTAVKQQVLLRKALHFEKGIPYIDWKDFFAGRGEQDG